MTHKNTRTTFDLMAPGGEDLTDENLRSMAHKLEDDEPFTLTTRRQLATWFGAWGEVYMRLSSAGLWPYKRRPSLGGDVLVHGQRMPRRIQKMRDGIRRDLAQTGRAESVSAGMSMSPVFDIGDRLHFEGCASPSRGDIALIEARTCLIVHRLVASFGLGDHGWVLHSGEQPGSGPHPAARWRIMGRLSHFDRYEGNRSGD